MFGYITKFQVIEKMQRKSTLKLKRKKKKIPETDRCLFIKITTLFHVEEKKDK